MKLTPDMFHYALSDNEKEQQDLIALCELLGMSWYSDGRYDFDFCRWVLIDGHGQTFQQCAGGSDAVPGMNIKAKDFIAANA